MTTQYATDGTAISAASGSGGSSLVFVNTATPAGDTVANTASETAFAATYDIPANSLVVGAVIRAKLWGTYGTDAVLAPTLRFKFKLDAVLVADSTAVTALVGATNRGWFAECSMVVTAVGASGSVNSQAFLEFATAATTALTVNAPNTAGVTVDTTQALTVSATVQWGTADTDNTITLRQLQVNIESALSNPLNSTINITPDTHPGTPNAADDEFETGATVDTGGARRSGATAWAWRNQGSATAVPTSGALVLKAPASASTSFRIVEQAIAGTWKFRAKMRFYSVDTNFAAAGILCANSSNGRTLYWGFNRSSGNRLEGFRLTTATSFSASVTSGAVTFTAETVAKANQPLYFELESDGTSVFLRISYGGFLFDLIATETISAFLTASGGSLDRIGLGANSENSNDVYAVVDWFRRIA